jgi:type IV pilus assembly protein PilN
MRISINLASRPFIELRPLFARLRLVMAALAVLAIAVGITAHVMAVNVAASGAAMAALKSKTLQVQQQTAANQARMRQPENRDVLERSEFLNTLFASKAFSWTSVMMDLEHVLPTGVQVTSIDPVIAKDGAVTIRLRVTGDRDRTIQLVRNLEVSQRFVEPRLSGEQALSLDKAKAIGAMGGQRPGTLAVADDLGPSGVEFEIISGYNPLETGVRGKGHGVKSASVEGKTSAAGKNAPKKPVAAGGAR